LPSFFDPDGSGGYVYEPVGGYQLGSLYSTAIDKIGAMPSFSFSGDYGIDVLRPTHQILNIGCPPPDTRSFYAAISALTKYQFADLPPPE